MGLGKYIPERVRRQFAQPTTEELEAQRLGLTLKEFYIRSGQITEVKRIQQEEKEAYLGNRQIRTVPIQQEIERVAELERARQISEELEQKHQDTMQLPDDKNVSYPTYRSFIKHLTYTNEKDRPLGIRADITTTEPPIFSIDSERETDTSFQITNTKTE